MSSRPVPALALAILFGCTSAPSPHPSIATAADARYRADAVVARVDGEPITLADLFLRFASLPPLVRERYAASGGLRELLGDSVASLAVAHEAESLHLERDPLYAPLLAVRREEVLRDLYARHTVLATLDDAALIRRYEAEKESRFHRPAAARVHALLVSPTQAPHPFSAEPDAVGEAAARAKAVRLHDEIVAGADFAAVARRASEDATAPSGGDIGWVSPHQLVAEVDRVLWTLPIGAVSDVIPSALGDYVVRVDERVDEGYVPFAAVRELLFQEAVLASADSLSRSAQQDRERLLVRHHVETHPELLP
jgi:hypothetical protein